MEVAKLIAVWIMVVFIGILTGIVLWKIVTGAIDLKMLVSEENGQASMSRFQFLIFTFAVVLMWIYLFLCKGGTEFVPIPETVLGLLGISGGSYVASKGIQKGYETEKVKKGVPTGPTTP